MSLSKPVSRKHIHTRDIKCLGYLRDDGLWDIEGRLTDTKTYSFGNRDRDGIAAGEAIHDMLIRVTVDDDMVVHNAEAYTVSGPYSICGDVVEAFQKIRGLKIGPGWRKSVTAAMGGVHGCTHMRDLLMGPLAVTAFQTIFPMREAERRKNADKADAPSGPGQSKNPPLLDTCYALRRTGPVARRRWPELFNAEESETTGKPE